MSRVEWGKVSGVAAVSRVQKAVEHLVTCSESYDIFFGRIIL